MPRCQPPLPFVTDDNMKHSVQTQDNMRVGTVAFIAVIMYFLQLAAGILVAAAMGDNSLVVAYVVVFMVTISIFACMTWVYPTARPYLNALKVGISSYVFGVGFSILIFGRWYPEYLKFDVPLLFLAIALGVSAVKTAGARESSQ